MPTPRETILAALHARLSALPATVLRGEVLPERVPADGLLILRDGEACEMEFAYVLPSGESFTVTVHAVYLPRPRIEISGPQGVQATFDWQAARDSVVGRMCSATLINDIEVY